MDLTIQILTEANKKKVEQTIQSVKQLNAKIVVKNVSQGDDRSKIRNEIIKSSDTKWQMFLNPGEEIIQGIKHIFKNEKPACYMQVLVEGTIRKEIRLWKSDQGYKFKNPVYEIIDCNTDFQLPVCIKSNNLKFDISQIQSWKESKPTSLSPYYYEASMALAQGNVDKFIQLSEHYMFVDKNKNSIPSVMNRYYYAFVHLHKKQAKIALQNLNICLCVNPLMAEFWCMIGDVYYYLLDNFPKAESFYKNAIILGSRRPKFDKWPMEISKYKAYPEQMIQSCKELTEKMRNI